MSKFKKWCKEHERELIICGATAGILVGTVVISNKFGKRHHSSRPALPTTVTPDIPQNALSTSDGCFTATTPDLVMNIDDNSIQLLPPESVIATGENHDFYRKKYTDIPDALFAPDTSTLNFVSDVCVNRFTPFENVVHGEHDIAVSVLNDAMDEILDKIDIDDIKAIQMLIDLK